jgi:hypothetical protein
VVIFKLAVVADDLCRNRTRNIPDNRLGDRTFIVGDDCDGNLFIGCHLPARTILTYCQFF